MKGWIICLTSLLAVAHGFIEVGKEFKYDVEVRIGAGTMDHAPAIAGTIYRFKARIQHPALETIKGEITDMKTTQYVGPWDTQMSTDKLTYTPTDMPSVQYAITVEKGLFKSLSLPSGLTIAQKNIIKAWAAHFQLNGDHMKAGKLNFKSTEETINGQCDVSYTVSSNTIYKTTVHNKDCKNPVKRRVDDVRGYDCEHYEKEKTDGLISTSNILYEYEGKGANNKITKLQSRGAFISQLYGTEGVSHLAMVNITATLTSDGADPGDISGGDESTDSLEYEFADSEYKWDKERDLKAPEPFFASGTFFENQDEAKAAVLKALKSQEKILHFHEYNAEELKKSHELGAGQILTPMYSLDYNNLRSIFDTLSKDMSKNGKMMLNLFTELLGSAGTTASAVLILDLLKEKKFDNQRDAGSSLTYIPFHIKRSNKQLVQKFKELLDTDQEEAVAMALPLTYGHLVRITCERAGSRLDDPEVKACAKDIGVEAAQYFYEKFEGTDDRKWKNVYLSSIQNLRWGGNSKLLQPLIYGKTGDHSEFRSNAIWAVLYELAAMGKGFDYLFPVFAEKNNAHEVRMSAVHVIMELNPTTTQIAKIVNILSNEKDMEVINGVFSLLEMKAGSISPCDRKVSEASAFFLKYLKQFSKYEADFGFGTTKSYTRQFNKDKYGYGGAASYYATGAHDSTTPLSLGMGVTSYTHNYYKNFLFHVHLRIEGLAKELVKKFKSNDPTLWKTGDLKGILSGMGIKERPDQPLRASLTIMVKGTVVIQRSYDDSSAEEGRFDNFIKKVKDFSGDYAINHQRILSPAQLIVEQPSVIGIPVAYGVSLTSMFSLEAKLKPGQNRGTFTGEVEYDLHLFTQANTGVMVLHPDTKKIYAVKQSRFYHIHLPRKVSVGLNVVKRSAKIKISRAAYDEPTMFVMHAETSVIARDGKSLDPNAAADDLKASCPSCKPTYVISNGNTKDREIIERDNSKYGYRISAKYFDCEMDIRRTNTVGRALAAFMPYNKNPRTPFTMLAMGLRQIRAFLFYFPRAEKCGIIAKYSQSTQNPVREVEVELSGSKTGKKEKLFLRGGLTKMSVTVKAIGDQTRAYRFTLLRQTTPGDLQVSTKIKFDRAPNANLGIKPYVICFEYKAKYPGFSQEMFNVDMNTKMSMKGQAKLNYGETSDCGSAEGSISAKFQYSTTDEARENLKNKWYYKDCMEKKNSPAWQGRDALPIGHTCYLTAYDASNAREYKYHFKFDKLTNRAKTIIENIRSAVRTFVLPYADSDNDDDVGGDIGPFLKMTAVMKEDDKVADLTFETSQGSKEIKNYPMRLPWGKMLRNLKFTKTYERLIRMGLVKPCQLTSTYVQTMDNVTYPLEAPSCWTLMSGHCSPDPSYAVFVKKDSSKPIAMKAYIGGHVIDIDANAGSASVNGNNVPVTDDKEYIYNKGGVEVFKITKWGSTFNIYSYLRVWIVFDGNFVNVVPAPSVKGQHCGLCGNYNRNRFDEAIGKDGETDVGFSGIADEWKWKC